MFFLVSSVNLFKSKPFIEILCETTGLTRYNLHQGLTDEQFEKFQETVKGKKVKIEIFGF